MNKDDPIDRHLGLRLRILRTAKKMSQQKLGEALDVSFQQIQKYEKGANRMSASGLYHLARALATPVDSFFAGLPIAEPAAGGFAEAGAAYAPPEVTTTPESERLHQSFVQIGDARVRKAILKLVDTLAQNPPKHSPADEEPSM